MAAAWFIVCETSSSRVILPTRSFARSAGERAGFRYPQVSLEHFSEDCASISTPIRVRKRVTFQRAFIAYPSPSCVQNNAHNPCRYLICLLYTSDAADDLLCV